MEFACWIAPVSRLSPHCFSRLSETDALHQRHKRQALPVPGVKDAFAEMHKVWKSQGADNLLDTETLGHSSFLRTEGAGENAGVSG